MRVLAIEPYYGGSHRAFLDQWSSGSRHQWTIKTLPAHHWKWRMRHAPLTIAEELNKDQASSFDLLFCSDMLSLSQFKGLCPAAIRDLPSICYFHENQLSYPDRFKTERDHHFGFDNFLSAAAADEVWFNSEFHRNEFCNSVKSLLKKMPDYQSLEKVEQIQSKSLIAYPGVSTDASLHDVKSPKNDPLHILWAARWEHDKNPEDLFAALKFLKEQNIDFKLSVLGESFREVPKVFAEAQETFADQICHWGYLESREEYLTALQQADVFVSTALHEFFGISAVEAVLSGNLPLLPNRLAYPELLQLSLDKTSEFFFYQESAKDLAERLVDLTELKQDQTIWQQKVQQAQRHLQRFHWDHLIRQYDDRLEALLSR